jgi:light-regulated signal transduction histidine kinase (bacteriophytochrome)
MSQVNLEWPVVTKFIRQLNHDLRNHLNAIELQAAFLSEIIEQSEAREEVKRLREMTAELGQDLQRLSAQLADVQVTPLTYQARELVEDLQAKILREFPEQASAIEWKDSLGAEAISIDPSLLLDALVELFRNAFAHERGESALSFEARSGPDEIEFTLREPKTRFDGDTSNWGARPLGRIRPGHYGLGLYRARVIFERHHGNFRAEFDPSTSSLVTTVSLPRQTA